MFVSILPEKGRPRNDLYYVGWDVKPYSLTHTRLFVRYYFGFCRMLSGLLTTVKIHRVVYFRNNAAALELATVEQMFAFQSVYL